jgi:hypothetical protein
MDVKTRSDAARLYTRKKKKEIQAKWNEMTALLFHFLYYLIHIPFGQKEKKRKEKKKEGQHVVK